MPKTAIIPPPAKSAAGQHVSVPSMKCVNLRTEQVGGKVGLIALPAEHREDAGQGEVIDVVACHLAVRACENESKL